MGNDSLERRKARIAEIGGWKALFRRSAIETLREMSEFILPMLFNRTVFMAFMICVGVTEQYREGNVPAETGGMVIAFALLWMIVDQIFYPFLLAFGQVRWSLMFRNDELTDEERAYKREARSTLFVGLLILALLGVLSRANPFVIATPVVIIGFFSFGLLFLVRGVFALINQTKQNQAA